MKLRDLRLIGMFGVTVAAFVMTGCGETSTDSGTKSGQAASQSEPTAQPASTTDEHSGWWCSEHGLPEAECSLCDSKVAEQFKAKGDWCEEHNRAESQCFVCHPELEEKFVALYEAKFGTKPPKRTE